MRLVYGSVYGNMALQLSMYYVSSHVSAHYLILRHSGVFEPTLMAHAQVQQ